MERILFIDDEQMVLDGFKRLLWEYRNIWDMEFALSGSEALRMIELHPVDVIITDIRMPGMSGLELLEQLKLNETNRNIPVVVLTADQDRTLKRKALEMGAIDLLNKPVDKEDLVARIKNVLQLKNYQDIVIENNKALEKQLVITQKMDLVGVMAAGAIHDLSNLLAIIVGYSSFLIEENMLDKIESTSMEKIRRAGDKASSLVNQILKFSRLDQKLTTINVNELIDDIVSILSPTLSNGIHIKWEKPNKAIYIKSNAVKLQQVLLNLCINGIQAMSDSQGFLALSTRREGEETVCIEITDTGVGMDSETMKKLFTLSFISNEEGKKTGLGLFAVKHILDEYKGKIEVESEAGKGTTFRVFFPLFQQ